MTAEKPQGYFREIIDIEVGKSFRPFENARKPVSFTLPDEAEHLLVVPLELCGINGAIIAQTRKLNERMTPIAPFGPVEISVLMDGENERVKKLPLSLEVNFYPQSLEHIRILENHSSKFKVGERTFDLEFVGKLEREVLEMAIRNSRSGVSSSDKFKMCGKTWQVLLPADLSVLSQVEVTFLKK